MRPILYQRAPIERLTREPGHWFYGYYDVQPFSADNEYHLVHRVGFENRMTQAHDTATVGMIRLRDNYFEPIDETLAWNFQQGSLLRWTPMKPGEEIMYNMVSNFRLVTKLYNVKTGRTRIWDRPTATIADNGAAALSVNFPRIYGFRAGYGYACLPDEFGAEKTPEKDGVWRIDPATGESQLVLSLRDCYELALPYIPEEQRGWKYLINHITLNPSGTRFVALMRGKPEGIGGSWKTYTITANVDGSDPYLLMKSVSSHYHWKNDREILFYAKDWENDRWGLYLMTDRTHDALRLDPHDHMPSDGHCIYSPDRKWILNDTYPIDGYRKLFIYNPENHKTLDLAAVAAPGVHTFADPDLRTDLHARWSPDGAQISFDSVHEGTRHTYRIRVEDIPLSEIE